MSLAKSSLLFALGTFLSRISGLLRESVLGGVFGASVLLDAFLIAFRIPNLFREMLAEGALGSSFTKVYSQISEQDEGRARDLLIQGLYLFTLVSTVFCSLGVLLAPWLVQALTLDVDPSYRDALVTNATGLTRLVFPFLGLAMLSSIIMGALHQKGSFFISAASSISLNLGYILGALLLARWFQGWDLPWLRDSFGDPEIVGLAVGVMLGGFTQLVVQAWGCRERFQGFRTAILAKFPWSPDLKAVVSLMIPASIAAGAGPINVFINTNFATSLGEGAVSWLNFAFRLLQLPIGLFGVAIGVAVLPSLSRKIAQNNQEVGPDVMEQLEQGTGMVGFLMLACFAFLLVNRQEIVDLLFRYGAFSAFDVQQTSDALFAYSFGILAYGLIKVLTSFYYAVERTSYAMKTALLGIAFNFLGNYLLVERFEHVGLAATSSITLSLNATFLLLGLLPYRHMMSHKRNLRWLIWFMLATILAIGVQWGLSQFALQPYILPLGKVGKIISLLANGIVVALVFASLAKTLLGVPWSSLIRQMKGLRQ
ncbi:murein biosynthesis integral membrane protein MurJ [Pseudobacteriovorax antillogorgiicola]|uniref:Probable lipid II flippase MurJ n=1 Tax=Pseudobacteriovorax antillogorgiicola TaxID=1513793 RepID=A0A1Y6B583_9BACT|nr:murein biosynthesis integral membrane protein MurJ [Pseudobacteriovorax antillogorgiicola]TCS59424.1 putative peptidoglycan lipid II flippase [Pseudobacteriovorax antillogorgiicola]SME88402.1 putative peptidoglycan lipid II flippase [Pseudobacteriovorax antillogorgiicola]